MKSQRAWLVLLVALPLLFGAWALQLSRDGGALDPRFAPVKIGPFYPASPADPWPGYISAGRDFIVNEHFVYNLVTRKGRPWMRGGVAATYDSNVAPGSVLWEFVEELHTAPQLIVREIGRTSSYDLPASYAFDMAISPDADAAIYLRGDSVIMVSDRHLYRWRKNRRAVEKVLTFSQTGEGRGVLSRDGKTIIFVGFGAITAFSAQNGRRLRQLKNPRFANSEYLFSANWGRSPCSTTRRKTWPAKSGTSTFSTRVAGA